VSTALLTALVIVGFVWLSRGSGRRLGLIGTVGMLLTFVALPFVDVIGARTDQNIAPTALALSALYPALWLAPLLALVTFVASFRVPERVSAALLTLTGVAAVVTALAFQQGPDRFLTLHPVPGVLETAFPLGLAAALYLLLLSTHPTGRARTTGIAVTVGVPVLLAALLFSGSGKTLFPQLRGYYQTGQGVNAAQSQLIVKDWALDIQDYLQADVAKRAQDWKDTNAKLAAPATGTDRAKQRKDHYDLLDEFQLQRRTPGDVTLGHDTLAPYLNPEQTPYFGATVGRYANRIAHGTFSLGGHTYRLATNNGPNHLHGGPGGLDHVLWHGEQDGPDRVQVVIRPELWEAHRQLLRDARALLVHGTVTRQGRAVTLRAERLADLPLPGMTPVSRGTSLSA